MGITIALIMCVRVIDPPTDVMGASNAPLIILAVPIIVLITDLTTDLTTDLILIDQGLVVIR